VVMCRIILSQHLHEGAEENHEPVTRSQGRDSNPEPYEYETGVLATTPQHSVSGTWIIIRKYSYLLITIYILAPCIILIVLRLQLLEMHPHCCHSSPQKNMAVGLEIGWVLVNTVMNLRVP